MILKKGKNHHTYIVDSILTVKFRGTRFAIGKRIADNIEVTEAVSHE